MIFVIFDIEIVFLYPFAVMFRQLALFGLVEFASFALVVFIAFAYLVSEGALDWGPASAWATAAAPLSAAPSTRLFAGSAGRVPPPPHLRPHSRRPRAAAPTAAAGTATAGTATTTSGPAKADN